MVTDDHKSAVFPCNGYYNKGFLKTICSTGTGIWAKGGRGEEQLAKRKIKKDEGKRRKNTEKNKETK